MFRYDEARAERALRFIANLRQSKGRFAGRKLGGTLLPFQTQLIRDVFGRVDENGRRQYRTVFLFLPRKNGKSTLMAGIALYLLIADGEPGAEVYLGAKDKEQASIIYRECSAMTEQTPALAKRLKLVDSKRRIVDPKSRSFLRALPREAASAHGYNAHGIVLDELHVHPDRQLYDVLEQSTSTRVQPLTVLITTAGDDPNSFCYEMYEYAKRVLAGDVDDPTFYPMLFEVPDGADPYDESTWPVANPALGAFKSWDAMRKTAKRSKEIPSGEANFLRYDLNLWVGSADTWIPHDKLTGYDSSIKEDDLTGVAIAGLDLAESRDISSLVIYFPESGALLQRYYVPERNVELMRGNVANYELWARQGHLTVTPGDITDYAFIKRDILELWEKYQPKELVYDRYKASQLIQDLQKEGVKVVPYANTPGAISGPTRQLERLILGGKLKFDNNPVYRWMVGNVTLKEDEHGNVMPSKKRSKGKIDAVAATVYAVARAGAKKESVYKKRAPHIVGGTDV